MRLAWLLPTCLVACSSSLYGTASLPETTEEPTTPESERSSEQGEKELDRDVRPDASDDSNVSVRANGMVVAITKGVAAFSNGSLQVNLRDKPNTNAQPMVVLVLEHTGSGCKPADGGATSQLVLWHPQGIGQVPIHQSASTATCGLTVARADKVVGGRAAGAFDGEVRDAKNVVVHLSLTFDVPVRSSL